MWSTCADKDTWTEIPLVCSSPRVESLNFYFKVVSCCQTAISWVWSISSQGTLLLANFGSSCKTCLSETCTWPFPAGSTTSQTISSCKIWSATNVKCQGRPLPSSSGFRLLLVSLSHIRAWNYLYFQVPEEPSGNRADLFLDIPQSSGKFLPLFRCRRCRCTIPPMYRVFENCLWSSWTRTLYLRSFHSQCLHFPVNEQLRWIHVKRTWLAVRRSWEWNRQWAERNQQRLAKGPRDWKWICNC